MLQMETKVLSVNISEEKGTVKHPVEYIELFELVLIRENGGDK